MKHITPKIILPFLFLLVISAISVKAQEFSRDTLISAARDIIKGSPFCALVTIDSTGQPQVRTMNPFPIGDDMVIWFATGRTSRKVGELKNNQKVSVYYSDQSGSRGYVTFNGTAQVIDDKELLKKMKREYWNGIPNWQDIFVLIKITPQTMDVINYPRGIAGDPKTSRSPRVVF